MANDEKKKGGKNLTVSQVDRQNILNNPYALQEIEKAAHIRGISFEGKSVVLKEQVAAFFEVNLRTVENYLSKHAEELAQNGYEVIRGKRLKEFKLCIAENDVPETIFGNISKTPQLGLFDFRAFLNLAMLMAESEPARLLRQAALDIVIDTINRQTGGGTKYINQRDEDFILSYFKEEDYRKEFTDSLRDCVDMGNFKYPLFTDKIYVSIFNENAQEYRRILRLHEKDKVRDTFYSEVLDLVSAYEYGFGKLLREVFDREGRKLGALEVEKLFEEFERQPHWVPFVEKARNKMASRDLAFRDALHHQLKDYITPINTDDFERFLGKKSKELAERLEEAKDVMKRLKECE
ncbi:MAG: DNA-binding protein [Deltaproteobacteria bacterium]|nr:DNA-binding protein [Deltaproteobacteria bacterium]